MRLLLLAAIFVFASAHTASADTWCRWVDPDAVDCRRDRDGIVTLDNGYGVIGESNINLFGFYRVVVNEPTPGGNPFDPLTHKKTDEVWGFSNNTVTKTWNTLVLTPQEIQDRDDLITAEEGLISRELYYFIRCLLEDGSIDLVNGKLDQSVCAAALRNAYLARGRLEGN